MVRQTIYCDAKFLIEFFKTLPHLKNDYLLTDDREYLSFINWRKYRDLFLKNATIHLNIDADTFYQTSNLFFDELKNRKLDGEIKIKFDNFLSNNFNDVDPHSLFFLSDDDKCKQMEECYGLFFISSKDYLNRANLLFSTDTFHSIGNGTDWKIMQAYRHPCNTIILIDNYIFNKPSKDVSCCLTPILHSLLPKKLKKNFSFTIFTKEPEQKIEGFEKKIKQYRENCKLFEQIIKSMNLEYEVIHKIVPVKYSQHDRCIITNYYLFDCGYGFVLTTNEKAKGTRLHINRITQPGVLNAIVELKEKTIRLTQ